MKSLFPKWWHVARSTWHLARGTRHVARSDLASRRVTLITAVGRERAVRGSVETGGMRSGLIRVGRHGLYTGN